MDDTSLKGWTSFFSENEARAFAQMKRDQGLVVRVTIKPLTQGRQIYPHRVSWWVSSKDV